MSQTILNLMVRVATAIDNLESTLPESVWNELNCRMQTLVGAYYEETCELCRNHKIHCHDSCFS